MNIERAILVGFLGNYLINTVVAGLASLIPASGGAGMLSAQYITFVIIATIVVALLARWYGVRNCKEGALFGVSSLAVAIATAFISGVAGVLAQTGSLASIGQILPNFFPFLWNWSTLVLACYWVIPATLIGWWIARSKGAARPSVGSVSL